MIDLSDESTWPQGITDLLRCNSADTRREKAAELEAQLDHCIELPLCIVFRQTIEALEGILKKLEIRAFHCTRLLDSQSVKRSGLEVLSPVKSKARTIDALRQAGVAEDLLARAAAAFDACGNRGGFRHREGNLCFALTKELTDRRGYADFFRYFGGEKARLRSRSLGEGSFNHG